MQRLLRVFVMLTEGFQNRPGFTASHSSSQGLLAGEVMVQQGTGNPGLLGDVEHGGAYHSAPGKMCGGNINNLLFAGGGGQPRTVRHRELPRLIFSVVGCVLTHFGFVAYIVFHHCPLYVRLLEPSFFNPTASP